MAKKSYGDLKRQMEALMARQEEMEQKAVKALTDAIMRERDAREKLAELSVTELQAVARLMVTNLDGLIAQAQADKAASKTVAEPAQNAPPVPVQRPVSTPVPQAQY